MTRPSKITPDQLKAGLSEKFDLVSFVDLAGITHQHQSAAHVLSSLHQDEFLPDQRIVFYSSHRPTLLVLEHLQKAASRVDISNWFLMICCPYDISEDLARANKKYGYDDQVIAWYCCDLQSTKSLEPVGIYPSDSLCYAPFMMMQVSQNGMVKPCCKFDYSVGDATVQSLNEIFHGQEMTAIRESFKQGKNHPGCRVCWQNDANDTTSLRSHLQIKYQDIGDRHYIDHPEVYDFQVSPSAVCNFKCRICNSDWSSAIAAEEISFAETEEKKTYIKLRTKNDFDLDACKDLIAPIAKQIKFLKVTGGETLLLKGLNDWLDELRQNGESRHIDLSINTNGSIWDTKLFDIARSFSSFEISLSIDDLDTRFEIQRGGEWAKVDRNVRELAAMNTSTFIVKVSPTVNLQNLLYLDRVVEYCDSLSLEIVWWYLEDPEHLCIDRAPMRVREAAIKKYQNHSNPELRSIANRLKATSSQALSGQQFLEFTTKLDRRRKQDFFSAHKELVELCSLA